MRKSQDSAPKRDTRSIRRKLIRTDVSAIMTSGRRSDILPLNHFWPPWQDSQAVAALYQDSSQGRADVLPIPPRADMLRSPDRRLGSPTPDRAEANLPAPQGHRTSGVPRGTPYQSPPDREARSQGRD